MNKTFRVTRSKRFGRWTYSIACKQNNLFIIDCVGESLTLANKIEKFLEEECQDIPLWFEEDRYKNIIKEKAAD